jgi:predicted KAP-like P-loop ATPase
MIEKLQDHLPLGRDLFIQELAAKEIMQLKSKINEIVDDLNTITEVVIPVFKSVQSQLELIEKLMK